MRKILFTAVCLLLCIAPLRSQVGMSKIKLRVILVDKDLNQRPVPHLAVVFAADSSDPDRTHEVKTDFEGHAEFQAAPGKYRLSTPQGVDFQSRHYAWEMEINVSRESVALDLSNDNARITDPSSAEPARGAEDLTFMFQKYRKSVVTVWSEIGSGTGFIVDSSGLVMTNQHVIGPSELVSVQFDVKRKVAAKVLAFDADRDVAVLYADLSAFPGAAAAPIATAAAGREIALEGERVFTIGSPLGLKKIITSGIVSKVEARAIISDVNINHGNSGGPLFNSLGEIIGITTFLVPGGNGPGVTGVVRIDQTLPVLAQARKKMKDAALPGARLLPVEPGDPYPLDSLKEMSSPAKFDARPYIFKVGGFDVALGTPVLEYELQSEVGRRAAQEKGKRTKNRDDSPQNSFEPLRDLHEWAEYTGEFKPVLLVQAAPQLRETFMSVLGREIAPSIEPFGTIAPRFKFRTDFYKMKLLCGAREIEPIQPGKAATVVNAHNSFVNVTDATYVGIYSYPPDAITPSCGKVTLQLYSEKEPDKSESKDLNQKSIDRVWNDFRPYLAAHSSAGNSQ
ncbi:MAG TPA: S1C family serine protease [Candidatus Acidoferrum sp.]|nr:S1C family serine protease [Candidatus Acidoferrum sp.]